MPTTDGYDNVAKGPWPDFGGKLIRLTKPVFKIQVKVRRHGRSRAPRLLWHGGA